ncbi:hypothetical protein QL285_036044 [Trifolium repens]|nr:hypothetical protein QL285_036044 [Trifolium repens]
MRCHLAELLLSSDVAVSPSIIGVVTSRRLSNMVIITIKFMEKSSPPPSNFMEKSSSSPSDSWRNRRRCCQICEGHASSSSDSYSRCLPQKMQKFVRYQESSRKNW